MDSTQQSPADRWFQSSHCAPEGTCRLSRQLATNGGSPFFLLSICPVCVFVESAYPRTSEVVCPKRATFVSNLAPDKLQDPDSQLFPFSSQVAANCAMHLHKTCFICMPQDWAQFLLTLEANPSMQFISIHVAGVAGAQGLASDWWHEIRIQKFTCVLTFKLSRSSR